MKRLLILTLAFALAGCGAIAPASPTPASTSSPQILVQTVVVTVVVTQIITVTPSSTPTATLTLIPTFTPRGTASPTAGSTATTQSTRATPSTTTTPSGSTSSPVTSPSATLPADVGGGLFTNLTRSSDHFALTCQPNTITFTLSTTNPKVTAVDLFYRMENQSGSSISGWIDIGKMTPDQSGNFTMDFPASKVDPDLRSSNTLLDYQFVGLDSLGQILGRSAKIVRQITFGCPG